MLHRIVMVGLVVAGLVVAGLGVASATVWRPSDTAVMTTGAVSTTADATGSTLLTTSPGVLSLVDEDVTVTAQSSDDATVVIAVGSQVDVEGWVGDDPARLVTGASDWETLTVSTVESSGEDEATDEAATDEAATDEAATDEAAAEPVAPGPNPAGSDMWVTETSGTGSATLRWDASSTDQVVLVAAVGEDAAAPQLTLSWPREVTTPLLWPGVALGVLLVVLGLLYGLLVGRRRRTSTAAPVTARAASVATTDDAPATGTLTRRQLRERAEREQQAATEAAARPKRQWPWTGAIPVVTPAGEQDSAGEKTADADPAPEPHRPAWLPEGTGSASGSSWRAAWGVRTPDAESAPSTPSTPSTSSTPAAPTAATPSAPTTPVVPSAATPATEPRALPAPAAGPSTPSTPSTQQATPAADRPTSGPSVARPATSLPPARPVDQGSPFQRITLRSGDESAPARRIRREQQPSAWSAPRSPWAQPARPPVAPTDGDGVADAPAPTDDTTKDSE